MSGAGILVKYNNHVSEVLIYPEKSKKAIERTDEQDGAGCKDVEWISLLVD